MEKFVIQYATSNRMYQFKFDENSIQSRTTTNKQDSEGRGIWSDWTNVDLEKDLTKKAIEAYRSGKYTTDPDMQIGPAGNIFKNSFRETKAETDAIRYSLGWNGWGFGKDFSTGSRKFTNAITGEVTYR